MDISCILTKTTFVCATARTYAQAGDAPAEAAMRRMVERAQASGTYDEYRPTATREHGDAVEAEREERA